MSCYRLRVHFVAILTVRCGGASTSKRGGSTRAIKGTSIRAILYLFNSVFDVLLHLEQSVYKFLGEILTVCSFSSSETVQRHSLDD